MSGIKYLLDTCFIIELYNGHQGVIQTIKSNNIDLALCAINPINRMEVLGFGDLTEHNAKNLEKLLDNLTNLPIDRTIENTVIELRKRHKIKLPDAIVLATALTHNLELLSLDTGLINKYQKEIAN
ncbi:MAG: PIN domain-containing protein [Moraxella sp.]|uniref:PIN domain-containing protein n=1 Tax=Moraxella sp. TaxID=479 RepID=UPI0026DBDA45|nr:PIN domain-containing protein [Moraxella sp.]MDO4449740.1 PIN domain-containing protein [Moraxella sp.]